MTSPRDSPAAERNKQPILDVLQRVLPREGTVLEIASGTGQHVVHFAHALPQLIWQPSEADAELREAIRERLDAAALRNVREPLALDVLDDVWPLDSAAAVLCSNMVHIAPWLATVELLRHASRLLAPGAPLILYGPFKRRGRHTAPSNEAFDATLRARNATWGVRDLDEVAAVAERLGLDVAEVVEMPANNLTAVLRRRGQL